MKLLQSIKRFLLDIQPEIAELEGVNDKAIVSTEVENTLVVDKSEVKSESEVAPVAVVAELKEVSEVVAPVVEEVELSIVKEVEFLKLSNAELVKELESVKAEKEKFESLYNKSTNLVLKSTESVISQKELVKQMLKNNLK